jgi:hypothetical protein
VTSFTAETVRSSESSVVTINFPFCAGHLGSNQCAYPGSTESGL